VEKILRPIEWKERYGDLIEAPILAWLAEVIFGPLIDYVTEQSDIVIENALTDAITAGLRSGKIWFNDGAFFGSFNAATAKELRALGATFDPHKRFFKLAESSLPKEIRVTAINSAIKGQQIHQGTITLLKQMELNLPLAPTGITFAKAIPSILKDLDKQFNVTIATPMKAVEAVTVPAQLSPNARDEITRTLTDNVQLSIKKFAAARIPELRAKVEQNVTDGGRIDRLAEIIEADYGVSKRKAAFLARQETNLFTSKYREARAKEVGSRRYKWHTRLDNKVRHDHRHLDGETFFWDSPPIVDAKTGRRANPGEDYNCRCIARPILDLENL
jgi:SPP1 gp7 family putative phage head morphogenesis protein